jgi:Tetratricopeptide repeat
MPFRLSVGGLGLLALLLFAAPLRAQDEAAADALFKQGLSQMQAGKFTAACPAFAESQRLDPQPGTLFTLAECEAKAGKVASAATHYDDYLSLYSRMTADEKRRQRGRDKVAEKTRAEIAPKVPKLTLRLPKDAPSGVVVERDGVTLGGAALGIPLPADPGEHVIRIMLGANSKEQRVTLAVGENREIELELPQADAPDAPESPATSPATQSPAADHGTGGGGGKTLAWVAGGIGVAGLAVGGVTGAMVFGKKGTIKDHCDGTVCDQTGKDAADSAKTLGLVSTIGFGVGIVGIGTAAVLLLTGGSSSSPGKDAKSAPVVRGDARGAFVGWEGVW